MIKWKDIRLNAVFASTGMDTVAMNHEDYLLPKFNLTRFNPHPCLQPSTPTDTLIDLLPPTILLRPWILLYTAITLVNVRIIVVDSVANANKSNF